MNYIDYTMISQGKGNGDRNDDFALHHHVNNSCTIGVIGDFTSDSTRGVNFRLRDALSEYLAEKAPLWRERLIAPATIAELIVRFADKWLSTRKEKARTTLIVFVTDFHEGMLHHVSIGDSGLALIHGGQCEFIHLGDTTGVRDASGFLPLGAAAFQVETSPLPTGATIFAYTDGLWENTQLIPSMTPDKRQAFLGSVCTGPTLDHIKQRLLDNIVNAAGRNDDLTLLVMHQSKSNAGFAVHQQTLTPSETDVVLEEMLDRIFTRKHPT